MNKVTCIYEDGQSEDCYVVPSGISVAVLRPVTDSTDPPRTNIDDDDFEVELGSDGNWYDVNDCQSPINIVPFVLEEA